MNLIEVQQIVSHISFKIFGQVLILKVLEDKKHCDPVHGRRIYLQAFYEAPCTKTNAVEEWRGGKHYLTDFMTEDEIVKRCYVAFEAAVKHEIMEGFKFDNIIVFNPHADFRKLMEASQFEVRREQKS